MISPVCPNGCGKAPWGVEIRGLYDGVAYWWCMTCGARWHRWPEGTRDYLRAECERIWASEWDGE